MIVEKEKLISALITQCTIVYFKCLHGVCNPELKLGTILTKDICFSVLIVSKSFLKYLFSKLLLLKILYQSMDGYIILQAEFSIQTSMSFPM